MISIIIAYYKNLPALELLLQGYALQSDKNFEIIIAEDAQDNATIEFIDQWKSKSELTLKHVSQIDDGFRKTRILNKAIEISSGDFIVFTDGDCIPHRHFIKAYKSSRKDGYALFGRRVMLNQKITQALLSTASINQLNFISILSNAQKVKYAFYLPFIKQERKEGIWGCNWGIAKRELLTIDCFDENYVHAGIGEDVDIEWRLKQQGIKFLSIRFGAIVYHLHHKEHYNADDVAKGYAILNMKKNAAK